MRSSPKRLLLFRRLLLFECLHAACLPPSLSVFFFRSNSVPEYIDWLVVWVRTTRSAPGTVYYCLQWHHSLSLNGVTLVVCSRFTTVSVFHPNKARLFCRVQFMARTTHLCFSSPRFLCHTPLRTFQSLVRFIVFLRAVVCPQFGRWIESMHG